MRKRKPIFPELEAQMTIKCFTRKEVAEALGITPESFCRKRIGYSEFTLSEIKILHEMFPDTPIEKLFNI